MPNLAFAAALVALDEALRGGASSSLPDDILRLHPSALVRFNAMSGSPVRHEPVGELLAAARAAAARAGIGADVARVVAAVASGRLELAPASM